MSEFMNSDCAPARRVYIGVTTECSPSGDERPVLVTWSDGRCWAVESVLGVSSSGREGTLVHTLRYDVAIGGRRKKLWKQGTRWFVAPQVMADSARSDRSWRQSW